VWRFINGPHGRPEIAEPERHRKPRFNLSHTRGLSACVVTSRIACGIDVEVRQNLQSKDLAEHVLTPYELAQIAAVPLPERSDRFLRFWTLKEAYAKARGLGFALSFTKVTFRLEDGAVSLLADASADDRLDAWQFVQWSPDPDNILAVAVQRGDGPAWEIRVHTFIDHCAQKHPPAHPGPHISKELVDYPLGGGNKS
jgi:4'-phosphopantetheinyl transferase